MNHLSKITVRARPCVTCIHASVGVDVLVVVDVLLLHVDISLYVLWLVLMRL